MNKSPLFNDSRISSIAQPVSRHFTESRIYLRFFPQSFELSFFYMLAYGLLCFLSLLQFGSRILKEHIMRTRILAAAAAVVIGLTGGLAAHASTVITFEEYSGGTIITDQYQAQDLIVGGPGVAALLQAPGYNSAGYPPASGTNVLYESSGIGTIDFTPAAGTWSLFGFYATNGSVPLTATAYDSANNIIGSFALPENYGSNSYQQITAPGIAEVVVQGTSNFYTLDNVTFDGTAAVPEPVTWAMMLTGFAAIGIAARRRRNLPIAHA